MSQLSGRHRPMRKTSSAEVPSTTRIPAISRRSIHCSESGSLALRRFFLFESVIHTLGS